jgi:hypothetical protein
MPPHARERQTPCAHPARISLRSALSPTTADATSRATPTPSSTQATTPARSVSETPTALPRPRAAGAQLANAAPD